MNTSILSSESKQTVLQNILFQEEFNLIATACRAQRLHLTAIKGISFFGRIYNLAERSMTDIDILIAPENLRALRYILKEHGYNERSEEKWEFNHYKTLFVKNSMGLEIIFEVHTQLLSNPSLDVWSTIPQQNYYVLSPIDELVYLAYHYAYQHTLLHSKWLHDIYLLSTHHPECWNKDVWELAKTKQLQSALTATAHALNCKYNLNIPIPYSTKKVFFEKLIDLDFIDHSEKYPGKYYVAKHLVKDSFSAAIRYDLKWLYFNFKKRFLK